MAAPGRVKTVVGAAAVAVGVALLVIAAAIPLWIAPNLTKTPLDLDVTTVSRSEAAPGATGDAARYPAQVLDRCSLTGRRAVVTPAEVTAQRRVIVVEPSDSERMTLQAGQVVKIDALLKDGKRVEPTLPGEGQSILCDSALLTATIDTTTIDRISALPKRGQSSLRTEERADEGGVVDIEDRRGLQYKFPFDVRASRNYTYFDLTSRTPQSLQFVEETTVQGLRVLHYSQAIAPVRLSDLPSADDAPALGTTLTMPARWWGLPKLTPRTAENSVSMVRWAQTTRDLWVEPATGTIVKGSEHVHQYYASYDPGTDPLVPADFQLTALKMTATFDDETQRSQANVARTGADQITLLGTTLPIAVGAAGGVLLLVGAAFLIMGGRDEASALRGRRRGPPMPAPATAPFGENVRRRVPSDAPRLDEYEPYHPPAPKRPVQADWPVDPHGPVGSAGAVGAPEVPRADDRSWPASPPQSTGRHRKPGRP